MDFPIDADGIWREVLRRPATPGPALFLDRDGVVVEEIDYLHRLDDMVVIPGAAAAIAAANRRGIPVVLITNQAGIGRGYFGWSEFAAIQTALIAALKAQGGWLDAAYACPYHPDGKGAFAHPNHPSRKPNPGMILRAAADLSLDLSRSWMVGDRALDIEAAKRAGLAGAMQVMTGYGKREKAQSAACATASFEVRFGASIADVPALPILCAV